MKTSLLVLFLFLASPAWAQEVTVLAQLSQTFREGTSTTNSVLVPTDITSVASELQLALDIPATVYEDPATRLTMRVYRLEPSTGQWREMASTTFVGGRRVDPEDGTVNPQPVMSVLPQVFAGYQVRAEVETNRRARVGMTVLTYKAP